MVTTELVLSNIVSFLLGLIVHHIVQTTRRNRTTSFRTTRVADLLSHVLAALDDDEEGTGGTGGAEDEPLLPAEGRLDKMWFTARGDRVHCVEKCGSTVGASWRTLCQNCCKNVYVLHPVKSSKSDKKTT